MNAKHLNGQPSQPADEQLFGDVTSLIEDARRRAAAAINSELVMLYWSIGKRIREDVLGGERAEYGREVVRRLAERLTQQYGRGYTYTALSRMMKFASLYPAGTLGVEQSFGAHRCRAAAPRRSSRRCRALGLRGATCSSG